MTRRSRAVTRRGVLGIGCAGIASLSGCLGTLSELNPLGGDNWSQYRGGPRNRGRTGSGPGTEPDDDWEWELEPPAGVDHPDIRTSSPVAQNGSVYLTAMLRYTVGGEDSLDIKFEEYVVALDLKTGKQE